MTRRGIARGVAGAAGLIALTTLVARVAGFGRILVFADSVRTGLVNINETTNYWENHLPFGGRAGSDSGTGRVGGRHALDRLTELQTIVIGARS